MRPRRREGLLLRSLWLVVDLLSASVAGCGAYVLRSWLDTGRGSLFPPQDYLPLAAVALALWLLALRVAGRRDSWRPMTLVDLWLVPAKAAVYAGLAMSVGLYFWRAVWISRSLVLLTWLLAGGLLGAVRSIAFVARRRWRSQGLGARRMVLIGTARSVGRLDRVVRDEADSGLVIVARVQLPDPTEPPADHTEPVAPAPDVVRLLARLDTLVIDEVLVALPLQRLPAIAPVLGEAAVRGLRIRLIAGIEGLEFTWIRCLADLPMLTLTRVPDRPVEMVVKRALDLLLSCVLLAVTAPLLATIWLVLRVGWSESPVFRQVRLGRNGRPFVLYKFRTMTSIPGGRAALSALNVMSGPVFKAPDDPRVTTLGRWLRRWSLDELPQLFNVLKGEMSLVGPRPPLPEEVTAYESWQRRRLAMRPGITGPWQVAGRNRVDFETWVRLDLEYVDNWSLGRDVAILARTLPAVLSGHGAF